MQRPEYLYKYMFDWELMDVVIGGRSALDSKYFVGPLADNDEVDSFLDGYGLNPSSPINKAELFGNFQEAIQFIKRYFLKDGNPEGFDFTVPHSLYMVSDVNEIFLMATGTTKYSKEEQLWAEIILKVMHTILHVDKDLRSNYFSVIQTQIFDRFYRHLHRDDDQNLYLGTATNKFAVPLVDFETKAKKSRDSIIIKLLHKAENVAEELFDTVGVRFITRNKVDTLRVIRFLTESFIVIPHNIKPSRSVNTLFDVQKFKDVFKDTVKVAMRNNLTEDRFSNALERELSNCPVEKRDFTINKHSAKHYQAIQFTGRQLIKYTNPFLSEFNQVRKLAREEISKENDCNLAKQILDLDASAIDRELRFFYPFEVQVMDKDSYQTNTEGEASHKKYKKAQLKSAMDRVFWALNKTLNP